MTAQLIALGIFILLFAIGAIRGIHIGVLMMAGGAGVGLLLTDMTVDDIIAGFPVSIMVLLVGVTYFFAIAQSNGTIDKLIDKALLKVGSNAVVLPLVFFVITMLIAAMGAPLAGLVMMPVGMQVARRYKVDFALMGLAICFAIGAGGFAPTSLYGIVTYGTAHDAGIPLNPLLLFAIALGTYVLMLVAAYAMFGREAFGRKNTHEHVHLDMDLAHTDTTSKYPNEKATAISRGQASTTSVSFGEDEEDEAMFDDSAVSDHGSVATAVASDTKLTGIQILTIAAVFALIGSVVVIAAFGMEPDIGLLSFALAAILAIIDPKTAKEALPKIDWSTVLLVGGIIMYVGVLETMGAVDLLGRGAEAIGSPLLAAFVLCAVGGLVSAFASTTGILAALVPLALPIIANGSLPGWALIAALGVCSAVVDVSPYSTLGATAVATAPTEEKPRLIKILIRWGLSMVIIGPLLLVGGLVFPAMLAM